MLRTAAAVALGRMMPRRPLCQDNLLLCLRQPNYHRHDVSWNSSLLWQQASPYSSTPWNLSKETDVDADTDSMTSTRSEWRKAQLDRLEQRLSQPPPQQIASEDDLQPMWKDMENRVRRRRPRTLADAKGRTGRANVKQTDEEAWLRAGLYHSKDDNQKP